eukprot:Gb_12150 [translate_table: standard]
MSRSSELWREKERGEKRRESERKVSGQLEKNREQPWKCSEQVYQEEDEQWTTGLGGRRGRRRVGHGGKEEKRLVELCGRTIDRGSHLCSEDEFGSKGDLVVLRATKAWTRVKDRVGKESWSELIGGRSCFGIRASDSSLEKGFGYWSLKTIKRVRIAFCKRRATSFDREKVEVSLEEPMLGQDEEAQVEVPCEMEEQEVPCELEVDEQLEDAMETFLDVPMEGLNEEKTLNDVSCEEQVPCEEPKEEEDHGEGSEQATKIEKENDEDAMEEMVVDVDDGGEEAKGAHKGQEI